MKKLLIIAAIAVATVITGAPRASAQSANFSYTGVPVAPLLPGSSFTVDVFINFTSGGAINNLGGFSYWMWQSAGAGFPFAITNRDVTNPPAGFTSIFTDLQSGLVYPQIMDPINRNPNGTTNGTDLGALFNISLAPQPTGTYFVAHLTFSVGAGAGAYTIANTTQATPGIGGRFSVITDSEGDTFNIANSPFTVTIVPEPSTFALLGIGLVSAGACCLSPPQGQRLRRRGLFLANSSSSVAAGAVLRT